VRVSLHLTAVFVALSLQSTPVWADLIGSNVTATLYYPNLSTVFAGPQGPVVVGPGIEFPSLAFDGTLDVTGTQIIWTATSSQLYGSGAFNGFDLVFTGAPTITGVTVNSSTTLSPTSFSFAGNDVKLNLAGLSATVGQKTILDIQTSASAVPEPSLLAPVGLMLAVLVVYKRRLFRNV
jgi:hypothetical protein